MNYNAVCLVRPDMVCLELYVLEPPRLHRTVSNGMGGKQSGHDIQLHLFMNTDLLWCYKTNHTSYNLRHYLHDCVHEEHDNTDRVYWHHNTHGATALRCWYHMSCSTHWGPHPRYRARLLKITSRLHSVFDLIP